jgi:hypothetical protein
LDENPTDISFTNHAEDFEGGATGWSNNTTTDGGNSFSEFLGQFGYQSGLEGTEKAFSTPEDADKTVIKLDVYEIDSWDGENLIIEVSGETISIPLSCRIVNESEEGSSGSVSWSLTSDDTNTNLGFGRWADQQHHLIITIADPGENVTFNISSSLNQSINDESFGIDNFSITSFDASGEEILTIEENSASGTVVATLSATDLDASDSHSYAITNDPSGFFEISGNQIVVKAGADIDFEIATSHNITVEVTDASGHIYSENITINVNDVDEHDVSAISDTNATANTVDEDASFGKVVGITAFATDDDATDNITYSLSDEAGGLFDIDASTGVVTVAGALDYETDTSHTIEVTATSDDGSTTTQTFSIGINDVNETISIVNSGFESQEFSDGGYTYSVDDWIIHDSAYSGAYNPNASYASGVSGENVAYLYETGSSLEQQLSVYSYSSTEQITFSVDIGIPKYSTEQEYELEILANGIVVGTHTGSTGEGNTLQTATVVSSLSDASLNGQSVAFRITKLTEDK